ncbi:uncharacterized protein A1O9_01766 [Exophiala aquamarina CBS 119918]|uniref:Major facilitator superfamily (MFS) profile domain-containing protein n=1 Tax=Exophiala aquamarina CBS 119918 TaxID=1182545 RepID=A0A072PWR2_9EURO|nr:uncharacterized protein A1O9_01766 [Exophiala aquamarina CBS 119918]KEF63788.1 hypothetical protein A1O9_01766 [Exophiala aquamarina CBS 119918]
MDIEKSKLERRGSDVITSIDLESESIVDPALDKALRWQIDLRLIPLLCITYALQSIDKTTLSYAAVFGIRESLELVGTQFSWASSVFYLGYLVWEYPTNLLLQKLPVNTFLSVTVILWGGILMCHAAVHSFAGLMAVRTFLGVFEASMNPATMIIFSMYYTRQEQPLRMGLWIGSAGIGYIIAGISTFGIGHINSSLETWRVMFLIWGAVTVAWGVVLFFTLPGSPATSRFWTPQQRTGVLDRIKDNGTGIEDKNFKFEQFKETMFDLKTWLLFLFAVSSNSPNGGLTAFQGLIIKGLGFSNLRTTLIQMPSGGVQFVFCIVACYVVSQFQNARLVVMLSCLVPFLAGVLGLWLIDSSIPYGRLACLWIAFAYTATWTLSMSVATANTAGHTKKVTTNAVLLIGYCLGNFIGPFFFKTNQAPRYNLGTGMMLFCVGFQVLCISALWLLFIYRNRSKEEPQTDSDRRTARANGFLDVTDRNNPYFKD